MKTLKEIIGEAVGQASMCWAPRPSTEVFNSQEAIKIVNETCQAIKEILEEVVSKDDVITSAIHGQNEVIMNARNVLRAEIRTNATKVLGQ